MDNAILIVVMRYLHIVSAVVLVGGMAFLSFALKPSFGVLDEEPRRNLQQAVERRFKRIIHLCFAGLFISGGYNWVRLAEAYKAAGPKANIVIGIKFLLAVIVVVIVVGRAVGLVKLPGKACHMINIHLVAIIILLGALPNHWRAVAGS